MSRPTETPPAVARLPQGQMPREGLATAGQPTGEQFRELAASGFRTVIDLRLAAEPRGMDEPDVVRAAGMEYLALPVGHEGIPDETFDRLREFLKDPARRPALVHCASANRVGAALIPYLVLDEGMEGREAMEAAARVGLRSQALAGEAARYLDTHR